MMLTWMMAVPGAMMILAAVIVGLVQRRADTMPMFMVGWFLVVCGGALGWVIPGSEREGAKSTQAIMRDCEDEGRTVASRRDDRGAIAYTCTGDDTLRVRAR